MQLKNEVKDTDVLELKVLVNGSFGNVLTLTGKEFKRLVDLLKKPEVSVPVVESQEKLKAGDDIAEKRGE